MTIEIDRFFFSDLPHGCESHGPVLAQGVLVPEMAEEVSDAYDDMVRDLGLVEDDQDDDSLPSCLPLLCVDYIYNNISSTLEKFKKKR